MVLGLLVCNTSFTKEIKISHKDENSISITRSIWSEAPMFEIAGKHCAQYKKYGNFYVEYECNGKPSGLATTKAKQYYIYLDKLYILETEDLKYKCRKYINTKRDKI